jgi:hypothetical protein
MLSKAHKGIGWRCSHYEAKVRYAAIQYVAHLTGALAPSSVPANAQRTLISPWIRFRVH